MNTAKEQKPRSNILTTVAITLVIGAAIGVGGTRWYDHLASHKAGTGAELASGTPMHTPPSATASVGQWDPFQEMQNLRAEVDHMFQRSFERLQADPTLKNIFTDNGYSSSLDVRDLKDRVEVRAYLPDAQASDAQVNVQGNQLRVEVSNTQTNAVTGINGDTEVTEWGRYDQVVQLPRKVEADKMTVERKDHELLITLPKAS